MSCNKKELGEFTGGCDGKTMQIILPEFPKLNLSIDQLGDSWLKNGSTKLRRKRIKLQPK